MALRSSRLPGLMDRGESLLPWKLRGNMGVEKAPMSSLEAIPRLRLPWGGVSGEARGGGDRVPPRGGNFLPGGARGEKVVYIIIRSSTNRIEKQRQRKITLHETNKANLFYNVVVRQEVTRPVFVYIIYRYVCIYNMCMKCNI